MFIEIGEILPSHVGASNNNQINSNNNVDNSINNNNNDNDDNDDEDKVLQNVRHAEEQIVVSDNEIEDDGVYLNIKFILFFNQFKLMIKNYRWKTTMVMKC